MDLGSLPILSAMKKQMKFLMADRRVITENIANADTPGYVAKEMARPDFSDLVDDLNTQNQRTQVGAGRTSMLGTKPGHVGAAEAGLAKPKEGELYEESPDGNAVELEEEMIRAANNQMEYSMVSQLYRKNMQILKAAMGKGGGR